MYAEDKHNATRKINFRVIRNVRPLQNLLHVLASLVYCNKAACAREGCHHSLHLFRCLFMGEPTGQLKQKVHESATRANKE